MHATDFVILAGAFAGGFVSGLTGFGTGIAALAFWLHAVPPVVAAPLVVICSVVAQLQTLPAIWHAVERRLVVPFILPGLVGVPAGAALLPLVPLPAFKVMVGALLLLYCGFMMVYRRDGGLAFGGRAADAAIGFFGGVLGGLAGLSGVLPTVWARLRGWRKDRQRAVFQTFNLTILSFAAVSQFAAGILTLETGRLVLVALPGTLVGAWLGRRVYGRVGDSGFNRLVLAVLMASGVTLIAGA